MLLYRETCRKCRLISALLSSVAAGRIERIGFGTEEGRRIADALGLTAGKLTLVRNGIARSGRDAAWQALAAPWLDLRASARRLVDQFR